jgi:hypothetical protein
MHFTNSSGEITSCAVPKRQDVLRQHRLHRLGAA